ncbi:MAG: response regulator [candidate division KSB1 bacterium]|nr:response regulator [candidate division KSB1 bacterium]
MRKRILVIEDYPHIVEVLKMRLEAAGYEVLVAYDGYRGLQMAQSERPDLIILDIMLPKMDGYKVCRFLKLNERYRSIPLFVLTSRTSKADQELSKRVGADEYFPKPYDPAQLMAKIREYLERASAGGKSASRNQGG